MANFEIVALDPVTPQLRAPGAGDNYTLPRPIAGANITLTVAAFAGTLVLSSADNGKFFEASSGDVYLPDVTSVPSGYNVTVKNTSNGVGSISVYPNGAPQYIDGLTGVAIRPLESFTFVSTGAAWRTIGNPIWASSMHSLGYSRPSATNQFAMALGVAASASGAYSVALGYASNTSNSASFAGPLCSATGSYSLSLGGTSSGSGSYATASGAIALGGRAGATAAVAIGIDTNSSSYGASSSYSAAVGYNSRASSFYSTAVGAFAQATGNGALCVGNSYNLTNPQALGSSSIAIGDGAWASNQYSVAFGPGARSTQRGQYSFSNGLTTSFGDSQHTRYILRRISSNATPVVLTTDAAGPANNNQVALSDSGSAIAFTGLVIAKSATTNGAYAAWEISGMLIRGSTNASTVLVNSTVTPLANSASYSLALSADTTNGGLAVTGTGDAAFAMRWVANIECAYMAYA